MTFKDVIVSVRYDDCTKLKELSLSAINLYYHNLTAKSIYANVIFYEDNRSILIGRTAFYDDYQRI